MSDARETLVLGEIADFPMPQVRFSVKYSAKVKATDTAGSGDGDAVTTIQGREPAEIEIDIDWPDLPEVNAIMAPIIKSMNPRGAESGKPIAYSHERNGLDLADENNVRHITIRDVSDESKPEDGIQARKYKCKSWVKDVKKGTGKTSDGKDASKFDVVNGTPDPANLSGKVSPKPPKVKP